MNRSPDDLNSAPADHESVDHIRGLDGGLSVQHQEQQYVTSKHLTMVLGVRVLGVRVHCTTKSKGSPVY